ncbi:hypothetical protein [Amycolatopsis sp. NPDC021455]|uniref:hypothetical protein n=1 Tax=Amycolatopsis sp. NPDC021455 TaxID=3154901 RepID=UPI0033D8D9A5
MDGLDFHLLVAALRTDRADVESYHRVLSETLAGALPPDMVEVTHRRTFADRVAGRGGKAVSVRVNTPDRVLVLRTSEHGGVAAEIHHVVRGVVISRKQAAVDDWLEALARELAALAEKDAKARRALSRLLGG